MQKILVVLLVLFIGIFVLGLLGFDMEWATGVIAGLGVLLGVAYFLFFSKHAENAEVGSLLRKHGYTAHETMGGRLVITPPHEVKEIYREQKRDRENRIYKAGQASRKNIPGSGSTEELQ